MNGILHWTPIPAGPPVVLQLAGSVEVCQKYLDKSKLLLVVELLTKSIILRLKLRFQN